MSRLWRTWIVFGACLVVVLASMAWISRAMLRLGRRETDARRQAMLEENVRLALWRMDSALMPLVGQESARPYASYQAFYLAHPLAASKDKRQPDLVPSPLLTYRSPHLILHFQIDGDGRITSPQVPTGNLRRIAEAGHRKAEDIHADAARLADLRKLVQRDELLRTLREKRPDVVEIGMHPLKNASEFDAADRAAVEWHYRSRTQEEARRDWTTTHYHPTSAGVGRGPTKPVWVGRELLLARRVTVNGQECIQGCWLSWTDVRRWLLGEILDLLPWARLEPVTSEPDDEKRGRMLAGIPVALVPGGLPVHTKSYITPIRFALIVAWAGIMLPACLAAFLLLGTVSLSERRAAFVSAVTHELRTPLTTLRMYAEMLDDGMVADEAKRRQYLKTMHAEADRLGNLVENVLAYARLEKGRDVDRMASTTLGALLGAMATRLAARAEQTGMALQNDVTAEDLAIGVRADPPVVEQVLFNLVDNACKYAASADEPVIHISAARAGRCVEIKVRDHGPGISKTDTRRLFRPFSKSAREAADSAPGIGLGLALSRRLARRMGGELFLSAETSAGACFVLRLRSA